MKRNFIQENSRLRSMIDSCVERKPNTTLRFYLYGSISTSTCCGSCLLHVELWNWKLTLPLKEFVNHWSIMDKMIFLRPAVCWHYHTSRHIWSQQPIIRCSHLAMTRTITREKQLSHNSASLSSKGLSLGGLNKVGNRHLSSQPFRHTRSVLISQGNCFPIHQRYQFCRVQPSYHFSSSSWYCDAESRNGDGISLSSEGSRDVSRADEERAASEERQASVRTLLDDAKSDTTQPDEFDFDSDSEMGPGERRRQSSKPRIDPAETSVLLFPGQGSQFVGMGRDLLKYPNVEDMFAVASEILGYDLLALCLNGPIEELNRTIHCQPAVVVTSLAAVEKLKEEQPKAIENCVATAGFSVGEFAALVFGGSLSFQDAIYLIKVRAEAMQHASEAVSSGMISVIGGKKARYRYACKEAENYCRNHHGIAHPMCRVANYLYPDARVLAGHSEALSFIKEMSKSFYLRAIKLIPVSGAFHTPLMSSAQQPISKALDAVTIETPVICIHSNVDGKAYGSPKHIRRQLKKQVVEPVLWEQTMHCIYEREKGTPFPFTYEMGPGNQLGSMLKRNNLKASNSYANVKV